jgi:hypothetical protein
VITVEVLLEGTAHNSAETVRREGTREHRDISETTLQRFVYIETHKDTSPKNM